jgi:hypothetical protein
MGNPVLDEMPAATLVFSVFGMFECEVIPHSKVISFVEGLKPT